MNMRAAALVAGFALCALHASAKANDSSATLDAEGLKLAYNPDIVMQSEHLHLGLGEIRVDYRFHNSSARDIETLVAFPLPVMQVGEEGNYVVSDNRDPINFIDFRVTVDGRRVEPQVEVKATHSGVDVTELLKRHGIPLTMLAETDAATIALHDRLSDLPDAVKREMERYGVMDWGSISGPGNKPYASAHWETQITFYWFQAFPAGRTIEVMHRYRPIPRHFFFVGSDLASADMRKRYCYDREFSQAVRVAFKRDAQGKGEGYSPTLAGRELKYVLTTAGNWLGPIKKFRLTVEKPSPEALVSLCARGLKRTSPTTFELLLDDYSPQEDINLLFVEPAGTPN